MGARMQAFVMTGVGDGSIRELDRFEPAPADVVVRTLADAVCTIERRIFSGDIAIAFPVIGGHEVSGTVVEAMDNGCGLKAGAVVALDPEIDAKRPAKVRRGIERRRRMAEPRPREAGDAGKGTGHDGNRHVRWLLRGSVLVCAQTGTLAGRPMQADFAARGDNAAPRY